MSHKLPTKTKVIRHTFRRDRSPQNEPDPEVIAAVPDPPTGLQREGRRLWKRLAPELVKAGILTVADLEGLEALCTTYDLFREARRAVYRARTAEGKLRARTLSEYLVGRNSQTTPELTTMRQALALMRGYLAEYGLTPAARSRIDLAPVERLEKSFIKSCMDGDR